MKRRVVIVGPTRYRLPLNESLAKKFEALRGALRAARARARGGRGRTLPPAPRRATASTPSCPRGSQPSCAISSRTPCWRRIRTRRPGCWPRASSHARKTPLILEVHGNWRTAARLYGSPARKLLGPASDVVAARAREERGRRPNDLAVHDAARPRARASSRTACSRPSRISIRFSSRRCRCPSGRVALFVGVLEHYKGIDELVRRVARRRAARPRCHAPRDRQGLAPRTSSRASREQVAWDEQVDSAGVAEALDRRVDAGAPLALRGDGPRDPGGVLPQPAGGRGATSAGSPTSSGRRERAARPAADPHALAEALVRMLSDRELAERLGSRRTRGRRAAAGDAGGVRAHACARSSTRSFRDEARLRHAAGRSRRTRRWRDRADDQGAGGAGGRGRRARDRALARRAAGELPRAQLRRALEGRARAAVRGGDRRRARPPAEARRGRRAHVPDLRGARGAVRPAARHAACCSGTHTGVPRGCSRRPSARRTCVLTVDRRTFPLARRRCGRSGTGSTSGRVPCSEGAGSPDLRAVALGRYSEAKGLEVVLRAVGSRSTTASTCGSRSTARADRRGARAPRAARGPRRRARPRQARRRVTRCSQRGARAVRAADVLVNNMRAGALDKVVYEAARAACRRSPRTRHSTRSSAARAPLRPQDDPRVARRPRSPRSRGSRRTGGMRSAASCAARASATTRSSGGRSGRRGGAR